VGSKEVFKAGSALAGGVAQAGRNCGHLRGYYGDRLAGCRERLEDLDQIPESNGVATKVYDLLRNESDIPFAGRFIKSDTEGLNRLFIPEEYEAFHKMGGHGRKGCPEVCALQPDRW